MARRRSNSPAGLRGTYLFGDGGSGFDAACRALYREGEWCGQITQITKDGERLIESRWSAVREKQSSKLKSILIVSTDQKVDDSTAGLAHEIRNPLASIKGVADAFLQRGQLSRQEREWMEAVRHEVLKIDARMREMLDVSQPRVFNIKPCSLSEIVSGVVVLAGGHVKSINEHTGRKISIKFIDETTEPLVMHLDPARIEDAVLNLVLNAIESIEKSGSVTVCLKRLPKSPTGDGEALIEVSDTGCGIPSEIRRQIFRTSLHNQTRRNWSRPPSRAANCCGLSRSTHFQHQDWTRHKVCSCPALTDSTKPQ